MTELARFARSLIILSESEEDIFFVEKGPVVSQKCMIIIAIVEQT